MSFSNRRAHGHWHGNYQDHKSSNEAGKAIQMPEEFWIRKIAEGVRDLSRTYIPYWPDGRSISVVQMPIGTNEVPTLAIYNPPGSLMTGRLHVILPPGTKPAIISAALGFEHHSRWEMDDGFGNGVYDFSATHTMRAFYEKKIHAFCETVVTRLPHEPAVAEPLGIPESRCGHPIMLQLIKSRINTVGPTMTEIPLDGEHPIMLLQCLSGSNILATVVVGVDSIGSGFALWQSVPKEFSHDAIKSLSLIGNGKSGKVEIGYYGMPIVHFDDAWINIERKQAWTNFVSRVADIFHNIVIVNRKSGRRNAAGG